MSDQVDVTWHDHRVTREQREALAGHKGCVVWFTGLSGSGKSTVANVLDEKLHALGIRSFLLDGDNVRMGLNASGDLLRPRHGEAFAERFGLGFSAEDREENIRRVGALAELFCSAGIVTLAAFVSPYRRDRDAIRERLAEGDFIEVFVDVPLKICEARDPKGLYKKARAGELSGLTGVDSPYEPPERPELVLKAADKPPEELADEVVAFLTRRGLIG
ncbi:MAG: adenylyl-sulfate kinase [Planctomycetes bacterium]|nr:adenylyl-sulfate kinase [Planctomycetota bacterium]